MMITMKPRPHFEDVIKQMVNGKKHQFKYPPRAYIMRDSLYYDKMEGMPDISKVKAEENAKMIESQLKLLTSDTVVKNALTYLSGSGIPQNLKTVLEQIVKPNTTPTPTPTPKPKGNGLFRRSVKAKLVSDSSSASSAVSVGQLFGSVPTTPKMKIQDPVAWLSASPGPSSAFDPSASASSSSNARRASAPQAANVGRPRKDDPQATKTVKKAITKEERSLKQRENLTKARAAKASKATSKK
jgi:hypothetical protein